VYQTAEIWQNVESTTEVCHSNFSNGNITLRFIPQLASN